MLIPENVRQECMPMMVYNVCRLVSYRECTKQDIIRLITAGTSNDSNENDYSEENSDNKSINPISQVIKFCIDGEFIKEENGKYKCLVDSACLESFADFTYEILCGLKKKVNSSFDVFFNSVINQKRNVSDYSTAQSYIKLVKNEKVKSENRVHGCLFWMEALGFIGFDGNKKGSIHFCLEEVIQQFIEKKGLTGYYNASVFFNLMKNEIPLIEYCLKDNVVNYSMSQGLRVLERQGIIQFDTQSDSGDIWHLEQSPVFVDGNEFSRVKVNIDGK